MSTRGRSNPQKAPPRRSRAIRNPSKDATPSNPPLATPRRSTVTLRTPDTRGAGKKQPLAKGQQTKGFCRCVYCSLPITRNEVLARRASIVPRDACPRSASSQAHVPFMSCAVPLAGREGQTAVCVCRSCKSRGFGSSSRAKPVEPKPAPAAPPNPAAPTPNAFSVAEGDRDADWEPGEDSDNEPDWVDSCFDVTPEGADPSPERRTSIRGASMRNELRVHARDRRSDPAAEAFVFTRPAAAVQDAGTRVRASALRDAPASDEIERPGVFDPAWFRNEILPVMGCTKTTGCPGKMDPEVRDRRLPSGPMVFETVCTVCAAPHRFNTMGLLGKVTPCEPCANAQEVRDCVVTVLSQGTSQQARARDFARGTEPELVMPAPAWKRFYEVALPALERVHTATFALVRQLVASLGGKIVAGDGNWVSRARHCSLALPAATHCNTFGCAVAVFPEFTDPAHLSLCACSFLQLTVGWTSIRTCNTHIKPLECDVGSWGIGVGRAAHVVLQGGQKGFLGFFLARFCCSNKNKHCAPARLARRRTVQTGELRDRCAGRGGHNVEEHDPGGARTTRHSPL